MVFEFRMNDSLMVQYTFIRKGQNRGIILVRRGGKHPPGVGRMPEKTPRCKKGVLTG